MNILKETIMNTVEGKSLISISSGISLIDKIRDSFKKAYSMGKEATDYFISFCLVTKGKSIYDHINKLEVAALSNITKIVTVKLRGRNFQFLGESSIFGKIALISQSRVLDWKEILKG